jgi:hypothetical protein
VIVNSLRCSRVTFNQRLKGIKMVSTYVTGGGGSSSSVLRDMFEWEGMEERYGRIRWITRQEKGNVTRRYGHEGIFGWMERGICDAAAAVLDV